MNTNNNNRKERDKNDTSKKTADHDFIIAWAEERGGRPSRVAGTSSEKGVGILRFDFGEQEESLEEISWDDFFKTFDERGLALLYQETSENGEISRFFKFVRRE